ncbi:MAG: hypothetical protein K8R77_06030 [Anaerolineaceae bacterium]|nr:hypothetical protein [Anaerolineaceae bacterium]
MQESKKHLEWVLFLPFGFKPTRHRSLKREEEKMWGESGWHGVTHDSALCLFNPPHLVVCSSSIEEMLTFVIRQMERT